MIIFGSHDDYITLLPSISIGRGWMVIDWFYWVVEVNTMP